MQKENRDYLELAWRSIQCFTDDGKLDAHELNRLLAVALRDGVVDDNEKRVLKNILDRVTPAELTPEMRVAMQKVREKVAL